MGNFTNCRNNPDTVTVEGRLGDETNQVLKPEEQPWGDKTVMQQRQIEWSQDFL